MKKLETRDTARGKARMEAIPTKKKREASKSLKERVGASLNNFNILQFILKEGLQKVTKLINQLCTGYIFVESRDSGVVLSLSGHGHTGQAGERVIYL